jgi:hypothetical protein
MGIQQKARPLIGGVSDLTAKDLVDEREPASDNLPEPNSPSSSLAGALIGIERLRALHHRIARTLAGFSGNVPAAAAVLGMDPGRIRNLKGNPAFVELVAFYRDRGDEVILDLKARMELLAHDSLAELHERLIGDQETSLTNSELKDLVESLLDRLGHAPVQRGVVANVNLSGQELSDLMQGANRVKVLEDVREANGPGGPTEPDRTQEKERNPST